MTEANQRRKILNYCEVHGSITNREAYEVLKMNSPTKRISELRDMGYGVQTVWEEHINSQGEKTRYKRYFISEGMHNEHKDRHGA